MFSWGEDSGGEKGNNKKCLALFMALWALWVLVFGWFLGLEIEVDFGAAVFGAAFGVVGAVGFLIGGKGLGGA
jgi:membrane associated rhomboid family serine protease